MRYVVCEVRLGRDDTPLPLLRPPSFPSPPPPPLPGGRREENTALIRCRSVLDVLAVYAATAGYVETEGRA